MPPPECAVVGDLHLRPAAAAAGSAACDAIVDAVADAAPAAVVLLGDVLHDGARVRCQPLAQASRLVRRLARLCPTYVLVGNHDRDAGTADRRYPDQPEGGHALVALGAIPGVVVVDAPTVATIGDATVGLLPYVPPGEVGAAWADLERLAAGAPLSAVFGHFAVRGANVRGAHHPSADSEQLLGDGALDAWPDAAPPLVSGHLHEPQTVGGGRAWYPGALLQSQFGHDAHEPAVHFLALRPREHGYTARSVPLPAVPRMRTVRAGDAGWEDLVRARPGDLWRVVLDAGSAEQAARVDGLRAALGAVAVSVVLRHAAPSDEGAAPWDGQAGGAKDRSRLFVQAAERAVERGAAETEARMRERVLAEARRRLAAVLASGADE